jgi:cytochrome P450
MLASRHGGLQRSQLLQRFRCVADPYPYYEHLRAQCPVVHVPSSGVVAVTGYDELVEVYRDSATFSAVNSSLGPFPLPFNVVSDDISELIESHRDQFPMSEHLVAFDPPRHTAHRALLNGLFTPKRLKENEEFMWHLADELIDEFVADGCCEFASAYGQPFPLLVIADLLGVPQADHSMFRELFAGRGPAEDPAWAQRDVDGSVNMNPLAYLDKWFTTYISDRRADPAQDILTEMATQCFPDGSLPEVVDLVRIATFVFIAGHETTARLLSSALRVLAEDPELQNTLRSNRDRIPNFIEEMLRLESPIKSDFRLTRTATTLGGVELPAGTTIICAAARCCQPGPPPLRLPSRSASRPAQRTPKCGLRARSAQLPRRAARPDRGPSHHRADPGQAQRYSHRRNPARTTGGPPFPLRAALHPSRAGSTAH